MRQLKGFTLILITLIFSYFYFVNINVNVPEIAPLIMVAFISFIAYVSYELYGYPKFSDTPIQITVLKGLITIMIIYLAVLYLLGIFVGYRNNTFCMTTIITMIGLVVTEIFRYILINSNRDSGFFPFITTLSIIILEVAQTLNVNTMISTSALAIYVCTIITPIILKNLVLTLYCQHINIRIAFIYTIIVMSYRSIIPIVPNLNDFTFAFADILLSFLVLSMSYRVIIKCYEGYSMVGLKDGFTLFDFLLFLIFVSFGILISGASPVQLYVSSINVQHVSIEEGDAPIVLKGTNEFSFKEKDVLMLKNNKIIGVSKIEDIKPVDAREKTIRKMYYLDEESNLTEIDNSMIKGKVVYCIKYIFKPSLKVKKYLNGGFE